MLRNRSLLFRALLPAGKHQRSIPRAPYLSDSKSVCSSNSTIWRFSLCLRTSLVGFQNVSAFPFFNSFICTSPSCAGKLSEIINNNQKHKVENNPDKWKLLPDDGQGLVRRFLSSSTRLNTSCKFLINRFLQVSNKVRHAWKHWLNSSKKNSKGTWSLLLALSPDKGSPSSPRMLFFPHCSSQAPPSTYKKLPSSFSSAPSIPQQSLLKYYPL